MSSANNIELLIITIVLAALFLAIIGLIIESMVVVNRVRQVVKRAEAVIDNVESAANVLRHMGKASHGRFPLINLIHTLFKDHK